MQRPPGSGFPPILPSRPSYQWISRIDQKRRDIESVELSGAAEGRLNRLLESEFVRSALALKGSQIDRAQIERIAREQSPPSGGPADVLRALSAFRKIRRAAKGEGRGAVLTPGLLLDLSEGPDGSPGEFRRGEGEARREVRPAPPERLAAVVEGACRWFTAGSFEELHPVEQASIAHLRLMEIQPFAEDNEQLSLAAASLFSMRSGLPPVIISPDAAAEYGAALGEGFRMNTRPLVDLLARMAENALDLMADFIRRDGRQRA
jgi:hypothetical protein